MIKKLTFGIFGLLLLMSFLSCATQIHKKANSVSSGMTQQQVTRIMGNPTSKNIASDGTENWYYWQNRGFYGQIVYIYFDEAGKVTRMRTDYD